MAGRYEERLPDDDLRHLAAPRPSRGYHSDDETRRKKKSGYVERQAFEVPAMSKERRRPSPLPQIVVPDAGGPSYYPGQIPSPPSFKSHHRRFSSQDVRPLRSVSPPPASVAADTRPRASSFLSPSDNESRSTSSKRERARHRSSLQTTEFDTPFPEPQPSQKWHNKPRSVAGAWEAMSLTTRSLSASSGTLGDKVYRYAELSEGEFRLVRILPARMQKIKCEVVHSPIANPPEYVAISYAWGDAGDTRRIDLGSAEIPVAASLHGALDALRQKTQPVMVWVDALCIDQQNREERTRQVQLMTEIYTRAESVAIWLGPKADRSDVAADLLQEVARKAGSPERIIKLISSRSVAPEFAAAVSLFERDYWKRLWVVQEVFNARKILVYCGSSVLPWGIYKEASRVFQRHKGDLEYYFPGSSQGRTYARAAQNHFTYSQILAYQGPGSLPDTRSLVSFGEESLLEVMRVCRRKFAADPKDKVFGILGLLSEDVRNEFPVDYNLSVKEIYTNVVDFLVWTTGQLDVICESIHYPLHANTANLPSWVPDWSHIPDATAIGAMDVRPRFSASLDTEARFDFVGERRNVLEISAVRLDTVRTHGISVGTLCTLADYLMAFVHWRALLLGNCDADDAGSQDLFCRTLCLDQVSRKWNGGRDWVAACYHVFASLIRERLPHLPLDRELERYVEAKVDIKPDARRRFLQEHFGSRMMGRCFYVTDNGRLGLGSGFMAAGDIVIVPFGCSTPIIVRQEGCRDEYRYVGDAYLHGYMYGRAIEQWRAGERKAEKFRLH